MPRFRKLPVEIEAVQWDGTAGGATPIIDWILSAGSTANYTCSDHDRCAETDGDTPHSISIRTLEGVMRAELGDWIIKGVKGEFYPCKPDIFEQTYALAADEPRLLDCGFCYEEQGEEVHPHPECPVGVRTEKQGGPVVGTARIALDVAMVPSGWAATESNGSTRQELFSLACQDMPVEPSEVTEAIKAADMELATSIKAYADGRRSSHGELWYDAILEMAVYIANLPPVVAP